MWVRSLDWEYPLEEEIATRSNILAWKIPRTEEPGGLQFKDSQRVGHDWVAKQALHFLPSPLFEAQLWALELHGCGVDRLLQRASLPTRLLICPFVLQRLVTFVDPAFAIYVINHLTLKKSMLFPSQPDLPAFLTPPRTRRAPPKPRSFLGPELSEASYLRINTGHHTLSSWLPRQSATSLGTSSWGLVPGPSQWLCSVFRTQTLPLDHLKPAAAATAKSLQSCPTLCDPMDGSPPGSPTPGILQARTLEWVAISFSNALKWKVKVKSLSHVWLWETPWTVAHQAPPSMGFSRQEYWSGVPLSLLDSKLSFLTAWGSQIAFGFITMWLHTKRSLWTKGSPLI